MKNEDVAKRIYRVEEAIITLNHEMGQVKGLLEGIQEVHRSTNTWMKVLVGTTASSVPLGVITAWLLQRFLGG